MINTGQTVKTIGTVHHRLEHSRLQLRLALHQTVGVLAIEPRPPYQRQ